VTHLILTQPSGTIPLYRIPREPAPPSFVDLSVVRANSRTEQHEVHAREPSFNTRHYVRLFSQSSAFPSYFTCNGRRSRVVCACRRAPSKCGRLLRSVQSPSRSRYERNESHAVMRTTKERLTDRISQLDSTVSTAAQPRNAKNGSNVNTPISTRTSTPTRPYPQISAHCPSTLKSAPKRTPKRKPPKPSLPKRAKPRSVPRPKS
jgi:hypothetical protein